VDGAGIEHLPIPTPVAASMVACAQFSDGAAPYLAAALTFLTIASAPSFVEA
jgi:hypothetical protein